MSREGIEKADEQEKFVAMALPSRFQDGSTPEIDILQFGRQSNPPAEPKRDPPFSVAVIARAVGADLGGYLLVGSVRAALRSWCCWSAAFVSDAAFHR